MVTHDRRILDLADRIVHLEDGCLAQNDVFTIVTVKVIDGTPEIPDLFKEVGDLCQLFSKS